MKCLFWVTSSRMTDIKEGIEIDNSWMNEQESIQYMLEDWVRDVFPMFDYTDAFVKYGYKILK